MGLKYEIDTIRQTPSELAQTLTRLFKEGWVIQSVIKSDGLVNSETGVRLETVEWYIIRWIMEPDHAG